MERNYSNYNKYPIPRELEDTRAAALEKLQPFSIADPKVDLEWASAHSDSKAPNPYYDYYFSAEDIRVYVAETADDPEFSMLPMHDLAFNIKQEKAPIYGAFSFTYDAVMRGTRLVSGAFTLYSKEPNYMQKLLEKAADNRHQYLNNLRDAYPRPLQWREDDANILKYWNQSLDPAARAQGVTEWKSHPPFSLIVEYGIQNTSVEMKNASNRYADIESDNALTFNQNQRLVENGNPNASKRINIDAIELMGVTRSYVPNGSPIMEQYEFIARDIVLAAPDYNS